MGEPLLFYLNMEPQLLAIAVQFLYLAVPVVAYEAFFKREFAQISLERYQIKQIIYDPIQEVIVQWIP